MKIIFATGNKDKVREIKKILGEDGYEILTMKEVGIDIDIEENGTTFEENSMIKARAVAAEIDYPAIVMADDSGLCVDAMDGGPGVLSARYMGHDTSYDIKNASFIEKLKGKTGEERAAHYVCAVAAVLPDKRELIATGYMHGQIAYEAAGDGGFGYDPIFYLPEYGKTAAELTDEEKNAISHRGEALRKMRDLLEENK